MQELKPIRVFLEVAAQQSFVGAATTLGMTPATVTRLVAKLEDEIGQQLLLRTTRQVSLTSTGALVAAKYRTLIDEFDRVHTTITQEAHPHRGRLSINVPMSFGQRMMPSLTQSFQLAYPNIELVIHMTDELVDIVETQCDMAIRVSRAPVDKSTIWRKVCEIPRRLVASPGYLVQVPEPKTPDDLLRRSCLSYNHTTSPETWVLQKGSDKQTLLAGSDIISNNGDFLFGLVRSDRGVALLPDFIVAEGLDKGRVQRVLPDWEPTPLWLSLYYPPYETLPPLVATFTEFFEAFLKDIDGFRF
ncbi:MAG: LysR family transcriptional regulator [Pseudomonadota bacterium]